MNNFVNLFILGDRECLQVYQFIFIIVVPVKFYTGRTGQIFTKLKGYANKI